MRVCIYVCVFGFLFVWIIKNLYRIIDVIVTHGIRNRCDSSSITPARSLYNWIQYNRFTAIYTNWWVTIHSQHNNICFRCVCSKCIISNSFFFRVCFSLSSFLVYASVYFLLRVCFFVRFLHKKLNCSQQRAPAHTQYTHIDIQTTFLYVCICGGHCTRCLSSFAERKNSFTRECECSIGPNSFCVLTPFRRDSTECHQHRIVSYRIK